ncbi:MAG: hypothetical protein ACLU3I_11565 [Acutalibacteraceae bacterium]
MKNGVRPETIRPCGIPVRAELYYLPAERGRRRWPPGSSPSHRHLVMMTGSMGCGPMEELHTAACKFAPDRSMM